MEKDIYNGGGLAACATLEDHTSAMKAWEEYEKTTTNKKSSVNDLNEEFSKQVKENRVSQQAEIKHTERLLYMLLYWIFLLNVKHCENIGDKTTECDTRHAIPK